MSAISTVRLIVYDACILMYVFWAYKAYQRFKKHYLAKYLKSFEFPLKTSQKKDPNFSNTCIKFK